jgi:hypothetical protein
MKRWMFVWIGLSLMVSQVQAQEKITAEEIMRLVRERTGVARHKVPDPGMELRGRGQFTGMSSEYSLIFDREGRFVQSSKARIGITTGFDGKEVWTTDLGGETRIYELTDHRTNLLSGLLATWLWIDPSFGMEYRLKEGSISPESWTLEFTHKPTEVSGKLIIDRASGLPRECTYLSDGRQVGFKWAGSVNCEGMKFPAKIQSMLGDKAMETTTIESAKPAPTFVRSPYTRPHAAPADVVFDNTVPADLEVKRAKTGHLLVKPKVNGKDVGWFIMDSGAGVNVLTSRVVKELELEKFGELPAVGIGGTVMTSFARPATLTLGRLTIKDPLVIDLDLSFVDGAMGERIGGVIGYGSFFRSVVEMDMAQSKIALFDPKTYDEGRVQGRWQRLYQMSRTSCVEAEFEGHRGVFKLDTGAAGSAISIHAPAVEKLNLLEGREIEDSQTGGVGGMIKAKQGYLRDFTLGGHRHEKVSATFATVKAGAFNSTDTLGNIGDGLLRPFRIVFDYQNQRIAFVKRETTKE